MTKMLTQAIIKIGSYTLSFVPNIMIWMKRPIISRTDQIRERTKYIDRNFWAPFALLIM